MTKTSVLVVGSERLTDEVVPTAPGEHGPGGAGGGLAYVAGLLALVLVVVLAGALSADSGVRVSRDQFREAWPLTAPKGILRCEVGGEITFQSNGTTYSLNRPAGLSANNDVSAIHADAGGGTGAKDLRPLLERGVRLCN